ncbi:VOC family protein [Alicyclobacillus dauci]|uniref:VOC family protein n=1 Tax=Alicyclobacillus dauci TaxID=1475485 RepID=A0ABY6Z2I6_9BACL|nr:VOC family protein [Alicyclobacillus dauci]WAH37114.1 VOC family protein [Alicyclobacillus dauci]
MVNVQSFHHVSIVVTDLVRAREFYKTVIGLKEIKRPNLDSDGAWFGIGEQQVHLIVHPTGQTLRQEHTLDTRDGHLALRVKSYHDTIEHLNSHHVSFKMNPHSKTGWPQIYVCDPDGNIIELNAESLDG